MGFFLSGLKLAGAQSSKLDLFKGLSVKDMRLRSGLVASPVFPDAQATSSEQKENELKVEKAEENEENDNIKEGKEIKGRETIKEKRNRIVKNVMVSSLKTSAVVIVLMFVACPMLLKIFPCIYTELVFLQRFRCPHYGDLSLPESMGLKHARNLRVNSTDDITLGVWHVLPKDLHSSKIREQRIFEESLQKEYPVMLYLHGILGSRSTWHRVQLYKRLANMNFHVFALDYRGFADSTGYPSEDGVVQDSLAVYNYIRSVGADSPVYIWGHSLGSAIATRLTKHLNQNNLPVESLILESGFNNLLDAALEYPVLGTFLCLPWHEWAMEGLNEQRLHFASDKNIADVTVPTLILHAEDDLIVPYNLGRKLYHTALEVKKEGRVEFVTVDGNHGYGHKNIYMLAELEDIIRGFVGLDEC